MCFFHQQSDKWLNVMFSTMCFFWAPAEFLDPEMATHKIYTKESALSKGRHYHHHFLKGMSTLLKVFNLSFTNQLPRSVCRLTQKKLLAVAVFDLPIDCANGVWPGNWRVSVCNKDSHRNSPFFCHQLGLRAKPFINRGIVKTRSWSLSPIEDGILLMNISSW